MILQYIHTCNLNYFTLIFLLLFLRLCLGVWSEHGERTGGFYACNRYESAKKEGVVWFNPLLLMYLLSFLVKEICHPHYSFCVFSMMRQKGGEKWRKTALRDIHIIMKDGHQIRQYVYDNHFFHQTM